MSVSTSSIQGEKSGSFFTFNNFINNQLKAFVLMMAFIMMSSSLLAQSIWTDKADYQPGDIALASGIGFLPGETVRLNVHEEPVVHDDVVTDTTVNADGMFLDVAIYSFDSTDLNAIFTLTATGLTSGYSTTAYFTDGAGDFSTIDFVAAEPVSYDHATGGGAFNDGTSNFDTTESLQGGDYACGDIVTYLQKIVVQGDGSDDPQTVEFEWTFSANTTGQPGAAHADVTNVQMNYGPVQNGDDGTPPGGGPTVLGLDSAINDDGNSTVTVISEELVDSGGSPGASLFGTAENLVLRVQINDLEAGESVVVRIDVELACNPGSNPTGNLQAGLTDKDVVFINGTTAVSDAIGGGTQTINFQKLGDAAGAGEPLLNIVKTVTTDTGTCGVNDVESLTITEGDTVKYCYVITNPGTDTLFDVSIMDDNGTPGNLTDDFTVTISGLTDIDGDGDLGDLAAGATATGEALVTLNTVGTTVNIATATGNNGASGGQYADLNESDDATVIVEESPCVEPTITTQPTAQTVCEGDSASFTVAHDVGTSITYQWKENGVDLANGGVYSGVDTATLNISDATGLNGNTYEVEIIESLTCSTTSNSVTLTVNALPDAPVVTVVDNCDGTSTLSTTATGTLAWSTGETTASITVSDAGDYTVTTTVDGCESAAGSGTAAPKTTPDAPVVTVVDNCDGTSTLSTTATGTLAWSTGETTASIIVNTAGDYTVTTTVDGCESAAGSGTAAPKTTPDAPVVTVVDNCDGTSTLSTTATGTLAWSTGETTASITVSDAGDYTVTTTVDGCESAAGSGTAAPKTTPDAPVVTVVDNCDGTSTLSTTATGTLAWSTGETTASITVSDAGDYTVTTTVDGCESAAGSGTAAPKTTPDAPVVTVVDNCDGTSTLSTTATGTLAWSTGETTASITVSDAGDYTVTTTVDGCESAAGSGTAAPKTTPDAPVVTVVDNCDGTSTLSTTATGTLAWSTGETTASITVSDAGDYTVTTTVDGCESAAGSGTAAPKTTPDAPVVTVVDNCDGTSTLSTTATGTLAWSTGETTASITVSDAGDYTVTTTVDGCESAAGSGTAAPKTTPDAPVVTVVDNCDGTSTLSTTATGTLAWSTGETTASITVSDAGDYTVTTTVDGCESAAGSGTAAPKTTPDAPVVTVVDNCDGTSTLSTTATGTLAWSTGETTASIIVNTAGDYTVTTTVDGCESAAGSGTAAPKTTPDAPVVTVVDNCDGTSTLSTTATGTLAWSTGETTASITVSDAGDYTVTTTVDGCESAAGSGTAAPKTTPDAPVVTVVDNCDGTSTLSTTATGTLAWSTGETTASIIVNTAGDYTVTTTVDGCESAAGSGTAAPKTTPDAPVVTVVDNCDGTSTLSTTATGTLAWSTGETTASITVSDAGDYTVTTTVDGCESAAGSGTAAPKTTPDAPTTVPLTYCVGDTPAAITTAVTATGTLAWYSDLAGTAPIPEPTIDTGTASMTTYYVTQTDTNTCESATAAVVVSVNALPDVTIEPVDPLCANDADVQLVGSPSGGTWSGTGVDANGLFDPDVAGPGDHVITYMYTDNGNANPARVVCPSLVLTGIFDGTLSGGQPKGVELLVLQDIADLSLYGIESANNGNGSFGQEFTFPNVAVTAGTYIYVAANPTDFNTWFGFDPDYTDSAVNINGDDAIVLYENGAVIDTYGDPDVIGDGEPWDYTNSYAYRNSNTGPDGTTWIEASWTYGGLDAWNGETSNDTAANMMPIGTFAGADCGTNGNGGTGCSNSTEITITVYDVPTADVTPFALDCFGYDYQLTVTPSGGTPPYTVTIDGNGPSATDIAGNPVPPEALIFVMPGFDTATYTANIVVTDTNGCEVPIDYELTNPDPVVDGTAVSTPASCLDSSDGTITYSGQSGGTPHENNPDFPDGWSYFLLGGQIANLTQASPTFTGLAPGYYEVGAVDAQGCGTAPFVIEVLSADNEPPMIVDQAMNEIVECAVGTACTYYIQLFDSFGDGWQGDMLDVLIDGVVVLDDLTLADQYNGEDPIPGEEDPIPFPVMTGDTVITVYQVGQFSGEASWEVTDAQGNVVASGNGSNAVDIIANCAGAPSPVDAAFEAWLANNGGATASDDGGPVTWSNDFCSNDNGIKLTVDGEANWLGFNNRFDSGGGYAGGDSVGLEAVTSTVLPGNVIELQPSLTEPSNGLTIEGNTYIQDNSLVGQSFSFVGNVSSNTLDTAYESIAFIKLFDAGFGFIDLISVPLNAGPFEVTYNNTLPNVANIQYGFAVIGPGAEGQQIGSLGTVVVEALETQCSSFTDLCGETGSATVTFTATDACGQTVSTTATFTVEDNTPPTIDVPAQDQTVECAAADSCTYYIQLFDSLDDGWQGDMLDVLVDGVVVLDDITLTDLYLTGNDPVPGEYDPIPFSVMTGDAVITVYQVGQFSGEASWEVSDSQGNLVASGDGSNPVDIIANCDGAPSPLEAAFEAWLTNNGGAQASDACGDVTWSYECGGDENAFTIDEGAAWIGYNNIFDQGNNYLYGYGAAFEQVTSAVGPGNVITLQPSLTEIPENNVEGNTYIQDNSLVGQSFTFNGNVTSNTLDPAYNSFAFIKIFDGSFQLLEQIDAPLTGGPFSVAYNNTQPGAVNIQYGFTVYGIGAVGSQDGSLGTVVVEALDAGANCFNMACGGTGSATVTFTATDACGATASTTATFTIEDNSPPVIDVAAQDQEVGCVSGNILTDVTADIDAILALPEGEDDISHLVNLGQPEGVSTQDWLVELEVGQSLEIGQPFVPESGEYGCTTEIEQSLLTSFYTDANPIYASAGQSFTIPAGVTEISAIIAHFGFIADQANITLDLYEGPASGTIGTPISSVSYTAPVGGVSAPPEGDIPIEFTFNAPVNVIPGNIYYYLVSPSYDPVAFSYAFASNDPYAGGSALSGLSSGTVSSWTYDLKFSVLSCSEEGGGTTEGDEILYTRVDYFDTNTGAPVPAGQVAPYITETYSNTSDIEDPFFPGQGLFPARKLELTVIDADELIDLEWKYTIRCLIVRDGVAIEKYFYIDPKIRIKRSSAILGRDGNEGEPTSVEQAFDAWLANNGGAQASDTCGEVTWSNDFTGFTDDCGETGSATVTFTATDACGLTASTTATFTIEPEALEVRGPDDIDASACEYADQEALTAAYNAWLAEFELVQAGCDGTGDFTTTPPPNVVFGESTNISLTFTATDGCNIDSVTASFAVVSEIVVEGVPEDVLCNGDSNGSIDITVSGGTDPYTIIWSGPNNFSSNLEDIDGLAPGVYSINVTDVNNCSVVRDFVVGEPDYIHIEITNRDHVLCYGESTGYVDLTITGGTPPYDVEWLGPDGFVSNTEDVENLPAGYYWITVTDSNGCVRTRSKTILQPDSELTCSAEIDDNTSRKDGCENNITATATGSGGVGPYTFEWDNGETTATAYDLSPGEHEVEVTDANGCISTCTVVIPDQCIVQISARMMLQGPYNEQTGLMNDNLRSMDFIPTTSPYSDNAIVVPEVFNSGGISGNEQEADDIVDWVWIELRQEGADNVAYKGQSALLQRDGDVVDLDGVSAVTIAAAHDNYYIVVNHRIHLGAMSANAITLSGNPATVDFTDSSFVTYGTNAQFVESSGKKVLWVGDVMSNGLARYLGPNNDTNMIKDHVLDQPGNTSGSNYYPYNGYDSADLNMDGQIRYMGSGNDSVLLKDCILMHPGNTNSNNFYPIIEQIPN